jgi:hypothetical protein
MANKNELGYLKKFLDEFPMSTWLASLDKGRILNVGAAEYGHKIGYGELVNGREIVGLDLAPGEHVDIVCDLTGDCKELNGEKFAMVICASVLEHCEKPWLMAANIERHLLPFGLLYVTVPWVWRTHCYPKDYWRISPAGIKNLFPNVRWKRIAHSTQVDNEFITGDADHDDRPPWRVIVKGRAMIVVQQVHMIGRMS